MNPDNIQIVLVEPQVPGNVGAVCRAMRNTGFSRLTLVNLWHLGHPQARYMAHGAEDILDDARIVQSCHEAIGDSIFVVGTTRRARRGSHFVGVKDATDRIASLSDEGPVSILFGREDRGLLNEELLLCQMQLTIPTFSGQPSLNLAQAVLIVCYELFVRTMVKAGDRLDLATHEELERMYDHLIEALHDAGFVPFSSRETFEMAIRRVFGRTLLERRDVAVIHKICREVKRVAESENTSRSQMDPSER